MKKNVIYNYSSIFNFTFCDEQAKWYNNDKKIEKEIDVELPYDFDRGCGKTMLSPSEPATVDIDFTPLEILLERELTDEEIKIIEDSLWESLSRPSFCEEY